VLSVLEANDNKAIIKTYVHVNNQILMQHDGDVNSPRYFYLHDRLGSVRQIIDSSGDVANCYYCTPWGGVTGSESDETVSNWYGWAGYLSDEEIGSYYCNARQYNAARFMTRDPVSGSFREPMTLHVYLYCLNDPINRTDPTGEKSLAEMTAATKVWATGIASTGANYASQAWQFARSIANQLQYHYYRVAIEIQRLNRGGTWTRSLRVNLTEAIGKVKGAVAHHALPQAFENWFNARGIENIHDPSYGMWVDPTWHSEMSHTYNAAWQVFIAANQNATAQQILDHAKTLAAEFGFPTLF
jgi:RHS repeat-associated protein